MTAVMSRWWTGDAFNRGTDQASINMAHVRHAPGQAVRPCPSCGDALVDTGDGVWAHAIGVEPCGWKDNRADERL